MTIRIKYVQQDELLARLATLYTEHPGLEAAYALLTDEEECRCCVTNDIGSRFGYDVAEDLDSTLFLLGRF